MHYVTNAELLSIRPLYKYISVKFWMIFKHLRSRKCIWKCRLQNVGHFVSVWICQAQIEICALKHRGLKKWPEFCRAYFQMLFVKWKLYRLFQIFWVCSRVTNFVRQHWLCMAWHRISDKNRCFSIHRHLSLKIRQYKVSFIQTWIVQQLATLVHITMLTCVVTTSLKFVKFAKVTDHKQRPLRTTENKFQGNFNQNTTIFIKQKWIWGPIYRQLIWDTLTVVPLSMNQPWKIRVNSKKCLRKALG